MSKLERLDVEKLFLGELLDKFTSLHKDVSNDKAKEYYYSFIMIMLDEIFNTSKSIEIERMMVFDYRYKGKYKTAERRNSKGEIMFGGAKEKDEHIRPHATISSVLQKILKNRFTYDRVVSKVESRGIISTFYINNNSHFIKTEQKTMFECVCEFIKECHYANYKNFKVVIEFENEKEERKYFYDEEALLNDNENRMKKIYENYQSNLELVFKKG